MTHILRGGGALSDLQLDEALHIFDVNACYYQKQNQNQTKQEHIKSAMIELMHMASSLYSVTHAPPCQWGRRLCQGQGAAVRRHCHTSYGYRYPLSSTYDQDTFKTQSNPEPSPQCCVGLIDLFQSPGGGREHFGPCYYTGSLQASTCAASLNLGGSAKGHTRVHARRGATRLSLECPGCMAVRVATRSPIPPAHHRLRPPLPTAEVA